MRFSKTHHKSVVTKIALARWCFYDDSYSHHKSDVTKLGLGWKMFLKKMMTPTQGYHKSKVIKFQATCVICSFCNIFLQKKCPLWCDTSIPSLSVIFCIACFYIQIIFQEKTSHQPNRFSAKHATEYFPINNEQKCFSAKTSTKECFSKKQKECFSAKETSKKSAKTCAKGCFSATNAHPHKSASQQKKTQKMLLSKE